MEVGVGYTLILRRLQLKHPLRLFVCPLRSCLCFWVGRLDTSELPGFDELSPGDPATVGVEGDRSNGGAKSMASSRRKAP